MIKDLKSIDNLSKPIQYLGGKNRVINSIIEQSLPYIDNGYVLDLFSGSSIVSQAFSSYGIKVISNDVQRFSSVLSNTYLNIDFEMNDLNVDVELLKISEVKENEILETYKYYVEKEDLLLQNKNTFGLLELYQNFPLSWKNNVKGKSTKINKIFKDMSKHINEPSFDIAPLFTSLYAGTYFGIKQSIKIDICRNRIEKLYINKKISKWQYNLFLTSLITVISKIVNSAGKHFAQPIKTENIIKNELLESRLHKNRNFDIDENFLETLLLNIKNVQERIISNSNIVTNWSMESLIKKIDSLPSIDVIYADPPYTAQQYSRFYHIPEILVDYKIPQLQLHRGSVTSGIYPENKFKSRFCSVTKAPDAFIDLFGLAKKANSTLILSYSDSKSDETGNRRMITLEQLKAIKETVLPDYKMRIIEQDLKYKQHNHRILINKENQDSEVLIIFSKGALKS